MIKNKSTSSQLVHPQYRADIDGLRAVAVLLVLGFHAFPRWVPGGYIGVDIFFVISGFLIGTILLRSLEENRFSFLEFYSRRIVRIFPALILVFTVVYIFGWFALFADEYKQLGKHIFAGAGFVSNFVLWQEVGYFDTASELKPFLHLWSLGIEEQFYIFWPIILWLAYKIKLPKLSLFIVVALTSFALNIYYIKLNPTLTFYSPFTRFWEILIGSIFAYIYLKPPIKFNAVSNVYFSNLLALFGIYLIGYALFHLIESKPFPGYWAIYPSLGACLIISAGTNSWFNNYILSNRLFVWFGLISFPLYLWHWPLLSFARILVGETPIREVRISVVIASIFLAWATVEFLEKPIRSGKLKFRVPILLAGMSIVAVIAFGTYWLQGVPSRVTSHFNDWNVRNYHLLGSGVTDCSELLKVVSSSFCATTKKPNVAIIGDSHAGHLFHGFLNYSDPKFNQVQVLGAGSCQAALGVKEREGCQEQLNVVLNYLKENKNIRYVFIAGYYGFVEGADEGNFKSYLEGYLATMSKLKKMGKKVIFVIDPPILKKSADLCISPHLYLRRTFLAPPPEFCVNGLKEDDLRSRKDYKKFVSVLQSKARDVVYYDPEKTFCNDKNCKVFLEGKLLYGDFNHLSIYGSRFFVDNMLQTIKHKL